MPRVARKSLSRWSAMSDTLSFRESSGGELPAQQERVRRYADDVRRRLKPVCVDWSEGEFEGLVVQIALTKVRWEDGGRAG